MPGFGPRRRLRAASYGLRGAGYGLWVAIESRTPNPESRYAVIPYYAGRALQLLGMWLLLVDLFTAGPLGPSPRLFAIGVGVFIAGWWLSRFRRRS